MSESEIEKTNNVPGSKPLYKKPTTYIGIIIILIVIVVGVKYYLSTLEYITTDDAYIDADRLELGSKILGRVERLYFDEGDTVKAGQLVAKLDSTDMIARLEQSKANLNSALANLELVKINLEKSQIDFNRAQAQYKDNVIPKAEFDNAQKRYEAAQAELKIANTRIVSAQSDIKVIKTNLENTKIYSPIDGVIAKRWVLAGDVIQPGAPIFSVYKISDIWVTAMLEETKIHSLSLEDNVEIDVDAYPDHLFSGKIFQIGSNTAAQFALIPPSNAAGNFTKVTQRIPIKISIKNDSKSPVKFGLLPGMSVEVKIKVAKNG